MNQLSKTRVASSLAITVALLYALCGLVVLIAPSAFAAVLEVVAHGLNIDVLLQTAPDMSFLKCLAGLLVITLYFFVAGYLYAAVHNFFARRTQ